MADDAKVDAPAIKPGWKSTEFWLTLVASVVGALMSSGLFADGSQVMRVLGVITMVLSTLGYTISRAGVKKAQLLLLAIVLPAILGACSRGYVRADAIDGLVQKVCDRHDKLLKGELSPKDVSDDDRATYLRSTELLRRAVAEAKSP